MLKTLYTVFLGILLAVFIGVGTSVFYVEPVGPEEPVTTFTKDPANFTPAEQKAEADFQVAQKAWEKKETVYNRNVSIITLVCAVIILTLSFVLARPIGFLAEGMMFGGLFTLIYSLGRGMGSDDSKYRFAVVTVCLVVAAVMGYLKFARRAVAPVKARASK